MVTQKVLYISFSSPKHCTEGLKCGSAECSPLTFHSPVWPTRTDTQTHTVYLQIFMPMVESGECTCDVVHSLIILINPCYFAKVVMLCDTIPLVNVVHVRLGPSQILPSPSVHTELSGTFHSHSSHVYTNYYCYYDHNQYI